MPTHDVDLCELDDCPEVDSVEAPPHDDPDDTSNAHPSEHEDSSSSLVAVMFKV